MKLSVSVPDDLWEEARRRVDHDSPSAVVQTALSRLVATKAATDYQVRPVSDEIRAALDAARARVVADAQEMFQTGYRQGLEFAARLGFRELEWIVRVGGPAAAKVAMMAGPNPAEEPPIRAGLLMKYYGSYADPLDRVEWAPDRPTTEGIDAALHDVWQLVTETGDLTSGDAEAAEQQ
jgi:hypothetical protein